MESSFKEAFKIIITILLICITVLAVHLILVGTASIVLPISFMVLLKHGAMLVISILTSILIAISD
jgi:hypothetical protein